MERLRKSWNKGEKNCNWNGGVSEYKDHYLMKRLRLEKLRSVNYKCELCGGAANEVHHKDRDKSHHDLNNFLALCRKCHVGLHRDQLGRPRLYGDRTLQEMADLCGVGLATIHKYFRHPDKLETKTRIKIESFLNHQQAVGE